jgi:hypothetical protein
MRRVRDESHANRYSNFWQSAVRIKSTHCGIDAFGIASI